MRRNVVGVVYLLHFAAPGYKHARHYMGWASDLQARLEAHAQGRGARLLAVVREAGISWELVRTWERATRADERRLKRRGGHARLCPVCRKQVARKGLSEKE